MRTAGGEVSGEAGGGGEFAEGDSYGAGWGQGGYCWIPFETMDFWSIDTDFWAIGAIEEAPGFRL